MNYILEEDDHFISNAFLNSKPTGGKIKVVDGGSSERQPLEVVSERKQTLGDDESNFNSREEGGAGSDQDGGLGGGNATFKKGLSRTKGSLQLPQMNNADEEPNPNNGTLTREHMYLITTTNNLGSLGGEEGGLSSDFKRNICDTSQDEVDVQGGAQSPEDLKDKLKDQNFFIKDFESGNVQNIIERA